MKLLIEKYNTAAPRYTSYPTVPCWDRTPTEAEWKELVAATFRKTNDAEGISLYIHLPFCESLCTYCGCNTRITVNHAVEDPYIRSLLNEWKLYTDLFDARPQIREIHLGGGTPTFFSPHNLNRLVTGILENADLRPDAELGFEGHPGNTTRAHLETLHSLGFTRISLGIQDFDPEVQRVIHRIQTVEQVKNTTTIAREIGFTSVNFDLIYGLPKQTRESVRNTVDIVSGLRPDRIAFYSYAHVPWMKPGQRAYTEADLPDGEEKRKLYEIGLEELARAGYVEIGMDHFALPGDELFKAAKEGRLHRNFMGYTAGHTDLLIGLGASSISDSWTAFAQNEKKVETWQELVDRRHFPIMKGHILTEEDLILRQHILSLMCKGYTEWSDPRLQCESVYCAMAELKEAEADGLVQISPFQLKILPLGKPFIRTICMAFDQRLKMKKITGELFSKTI